MITDLLIIFISILLSAFFSGTEIAFISTNRMQAELEKKKDNFLSRIFTFLYNRPKRFISTMLIGNTICLVVYGYYSGKLLTELIQHFFHIEQEGILLLVQTLISTFIILITAEYLPKAIFSSRPYTFFKFFVLPAYFFYYLLYPVVFIMNGITDMFLRMVKKNPDADKDILFKEEMSYFISEKMEEIDNEKIDSEVQIFKNALHFSDLKARECMIPRKEIVGFDINEPIEKIKQKFIDTGYSKLMIYRDNIDHIIGYVHAFDMFKKPKYIRNVLHPVEMAHENAPIKDIMKVLTKKRRSVAIIIDEYGGTSGMLTLEDIVEELFGDIEDEHDKPTLKQELLSEDEYLFSARLEIDYLNQQYDLDLPESDSYETLGGFIVNQLEDIPTEGETFTYDNLKFEISKVSNTRIEEVKVKLTD